MRVVGIIGAGAAGLCALRHVLNTPGLVPIIWEQSREVGGTWVYTDKLDKDDHGLPIHSSMYKSLKTNLPKETMGFPDFPFPEGGDSFIHHTQVLSYLKSYTQHFDLQKHIKFSHLVESVVPTSPGNPDTEWQVTVRDLNTQRLNTVLCHAMLVCNGHYSVPNVPDIPGIGSFKGTTQHSHSYRSPEQYRGLRVAVLGAAASGMDIALEIAAVAKQVHLCHNLPIPIPSQLPANLQQVAGIEALKAGTSDTLTLRGGGEVQADALVYCTGYQYTFPFLSPECDVTVVSNQVRPLYRHLIHCRHPTMAFVGIPFQICPFPFFDVQVRYFIHCLVGELPLPDCEAMLAAFDRECRERQAWGEAPRHHHSMLRDGRLWSYLRLLEGEMRSGRRQRDDSEGVESSGHDDADVLPHLRAMWDISFMRRLLQLPDYKKYNYSVITPAGREVSQARHLSRETSCPSRGTVLVETRDGEVTRPWKDIILLVLRRAPGVLVGNLWTITKLVASLVYYKTKKLLCRF